MNSVGIDTFLQATQAVPKAKPSAAREGERADEFNDYLRQATGAQQSPAKEKPAVQAKSAVERTQTTPHDQDSPKSPDDQLAPAVATTESAEETVDEPSTGSEADEVLLSVAGLAAVTPEVGPTDQEPVVELDVATEVVATDAVPKQSSEEKSEEKGTPSDFLPDLEQAIAVESVANPEEVVAAPEMPPDGVSVAVGEEADQAIAPQLATEIPVSKTGVAQVTAEGQIEQQAADVSTEETVPVSIPEVVQTASLPQKNKIAAKVETKSNGVAEKSDSTERKSSKSTASEQDPIAEQVVAQVAATLTDAEPAHESKHKAGNEATSVTTATHADVSTQQRTQAADTTERSAQALNSDQDSRMPALDRSRFVQRVANAFRSAQHNDGHIQMRLSPPELGSLRIEIAVRHGVLSANLETETADARRVVLDNLPALRQRLAEQDIRIEKFDVDVRRDGGQSDGQAGAQDRHAQQQSQRAAAQNRIRTALPAEVVSARAPRPHIASADNGLDVRI